MDRRVRVTARILITGTLSLPVIATTTVRITVRVIITVRATLSNRTSDRISDGDYKW